MSDNQLVQSNTLSNGAYQSASKITPKGWAIIAALVIGACAYVACCCAESKSKLAVHYYFRAQQCFDAGNLGESIHFLNLAKVNGCDPVECNRLIAEITSIGEARRREMERREQEVRIINEQRDAAIREGRVFVPSGTQQRSGLNGWSGGTAPQKYDNERYLY